MNFLGVTYDNVKNHKKAGSCTFFRRYIFQKITWGGISFWSSPAVLGLKELL